MKNTNKTLYRAWLSNGKHGQTVYRAWLSNGKHGQTLYRAWLSNRKHGQKCTGHDYPMKNPNKTLYRAWLSNGKHGQTLYRAWLSNGKHGQNIVHDMTIKWKTRTKHCTGHAYTMENTDKNVQDMIIQWKTRTKHYSIIKTYYKNGALTLQFPNWTKR